MNILLLHRDFRTKDNIALNELLKHSKNVYIFFIFNKKQIENNTFFSYHSFQYMMHALKQLNAQVNINFFKAASEIEVFEKMIKGKADIKRVYWNKDFTPFALKRSQKLEEFCKNNKIETKTPNDYLLINPDEETEFISAKVFTPFWNKILDRLNKKLPKVSRKVTFNALEYRNTLTINIHEIKFEQKMNFHLSRPDIISSINSIYKDYKDNRDMLCLDTNSQIAPAIKFGVISIREIVTLIHKKQKSLDNDYFRQIIWREFFYQFHIQKDRKSLQENLLNRFDKFQWKEDKKKFDAWCKGETGFDIVDAAMNQLNQTGYMHNRARMIVASFLTKNLLLDWRLGEKYFAQKLVDYDPIVNNMSWQWVSGTGFEVNPFFRIFNPMLQKAKFDPEGLYTKRWLPENYKTQHIVDYKESRKEALDLYKETFKST